MSTGPAHDRLYDALFEDDDRLCEAIPDGACTNVPKNFFLNALNGSATKLAEQVASPGLVLPWFLAALGAPASFSGFLVPIKRVFSLAPQLLVAGTLRGFTRRKWFWVAAGFVQALMLGIMLFAAAAFSPVSAGVAVLVTFALFSTASGVGSVAFQDVMGKTIPKGRRGRLLAIRAASGGILTLGAGAFLQIYIGDDAPVGVYYGMIAFAAFLWFVAALLFSSIAEEPGATGGGRNAAGEIREGIKLLVSVKDFRTFVAVRCLLVSVAVSLPFYALYARQLTGTGAGNLGIFVIVIGMANIVSSPFWGYFSDLSSRRVMVLSGFLAASAGILALTIGQLPETWHLAYIYAPVIFLIGISEAGVRTGRKTYLVDAAPEEERPLYVAMSNSVVGIFALTLGGFGILSDIVGIEILLMVFIGFAVVAALTAFRLPSVDSFGKE